MGTVLGWVCSAVSLLVWLELYALWRWHSTYWLSGSELRWVVLLGGALLFLGVALFVFVQWEIAQRPAADLSSSPTALSVSRRNPDRTAVALLTSALAVVIVVGVVLVNVPSLAPLRTCAGDCGLYELGLELTGSSQPEPGLFYTALEVSPTLGLTTGMFGLKLTNSSGGPIMAGTAPAACAPVGNTTPFGPSKCGAPSQGWYAVLVLHDGNITGTFDVAGHWRGSSVPVLGSDLLYLVSDTNLTVPAGTLSAYSIVGSVTVWGEVYL